MSLRDVTQLQFATGVEYDQGLQSLRNGAFDTARSRLLTALSGESRVWARREIESALARTALLTNNRLEALEIVSRIAEDDPLTRHVELLPLLWTTDDSPESRITKSDQITSRSFMTRLLTASEWLTSKSVRSNCIEAFNELRLSGLRNIADLAEVQLWRARLLKSNELRRNHIDLWNARLNTLSPEALAGAHLVIGQAHMMLNDYESAALHLLRHPLTSHANPLTQQASMRLAVDSLHQLNRTTQANNMQAEYERRFASTAK